MSIKKCSVCNTSWPEAEIDDLGRCHNCGLEDHDQVEAARFCPICKTILPEMELTGFDICRKCRSENEALKQPGKKDKIRPSKQLNLNLLEE